LANKQDNRVRTSYLQKEAACVTVKQTARLIAKREKKTEYLIRFSQV